MDTMVIENADLLLKRIKKSNKVKAVSGGMSIPSTMKPLVLSNFSLPIYMLSSKRKTKELHRRHWSLPGYRRIVLNNDGSFNTRVVRIS